jgi:hypothetical protein
MDARREDLFPWRLFRPGIPQRDGAIKNQLSGTGVEIETEVTESFKLNAFAFREIGQRALQLGLHHFE